MSLIQEIINETYHDTTEFTPHELHFNLKPVRVWSKWIQEGSSQGDTMNHEEKIAHAREKMKKKQRRERKRMIMQIKACFVSLKLEREFY